MSRQGDCCKLSCIPPNSYVGVPETITIFKDKAFKEVIKLKGESLVASWVKNLPAMQETRVQFLGGEDPLEKEMATHSSILAWKIPWKKEPGRLQSDTNEVT